MQRFLLHIFGPTATKSYPLFGLSELGNFTKSSPKVPALDTAFGDSPPLVTYCQKFGESESHPTCWHISWAKHKQARAPVSSRCSKLPSSVRTLKNSSRWTCSRRTDHSCNASAPGAQVLRRDLHGDATWWWPNGARFLVSEPGHVRVMAAGRREVSTRRTLHELLEMVPATDHCLDW